MAAELSPNPTLLSIYLWERRGAEPLSVFKRLHVAKSNFPQQVQTVGMYTCRSMDKIVGMYMLLF